jgi:hypothetical protein
LVNARSSGSDWTPRLPTRSIRPCNTSTVARASASARWIGWVREWKNGASVLSRQFGTSSRLSTRRARTAVSITAGLPGVPGCGGRRAESPRRTARCARQPGAAGELEERRKDGVERRGFGHHAVGDPSEDATNGLIGHPLD